LEAFWKVRALFFSVENLSFFPTLSTGSFPIFHSVFWKTSWELVKLRNGSVRSCRSICSQTLCPFPSLP
jgi:hypothetical protein